MQRAEVVVVGSGYAGVSAAIELHRHGVDVVVVEASTRIGGRVLTERSPTGHAIDLGGMWLGAGQTEFARWASEAGAVTYPTPATGDAILRDRGRDRRYDPAGSPPLGMIGGALLASSAWRLERLSRLIDLDEPWASPRADRLDAVTVAAWLRNAVPFGRGRQLAEVVLAEVLTADPGSVSMLALLTYLRSAGGLRPALGTENGAQQDLFVDGADRPLRHVAEGLGDRIELSAPVTEIDHGGPEVVVRSDRHDIACERVVVAVPPHLAGRIRYVPGLPADRDAIMQRIPMGRVVKAIAAYDEPFWRRDGLGGEALDLSGPVPATFDISPPGGPGLLCALVGGRRADALGRLEVGERERVVTAQFTSLFGPRARRAVAYRDKVWADDIHARGGYSGYFPPGVLTEVGSALRAPVGRIHWAGTETATEFIGYIEGAIRSGQRAAAEVRARIGAVTGDLAGDGGSNRVG